MTPQINQLPNNNGFLIRNHSGEVYKTIATLYKGKYHFQTKLVTTSLNYVMDGVKLAKVPDYLKAEFFDLMKK
jgi:hypothetical protein